MHEEYKPVFIYSKLNHSNGYQRIMQSFLNNLPPLREITKDWILEFLSSYSNQSTRHLKFAMLSIVLKRLDKSELIEDVEIKRPKKSLKRSELLSQVELSSMLRACENTEQKAVLEFLIESGCRASELLGLEVEDIEIQQDFIIATLNGKTGIRTVPLLRQNLTNFLYHSQFFESGKIFDFSYSRLRTIILGIYRRADVRKRKRVTHIFRHMKATYLLEKGVPEQMIKRFMGWSESSDMISNYTHLTSKNIEDFFARLYNLSSEPVEELYPNEEKERLKQIFG